MGGLFFNRESKLVQQDYITLAPTRVRLGLDLLAGLEGRAEVVANPTHGLTIRRLRPGVAKGQYLTHWQVIEEDFG